MSRMINDKFGVDAFHYELELTYLSHMMKHGCNPFPFYNDSVWDAFKFINSASGEWAWPSQFYVSLKEIGTQLGLQPVVLDSSPTNNSSGGDVSADFVVDFVGLESNPWMNIESANSIPEKLMYGIENRALGTYISTTGMDMTGTGTCTTMITNQAEMTTNVLENDREKLVICVSRNEEETIYGEGHQAHEPSFHSGSSSKEDHDIPHAIKSKSR